MWCGGEYPPSQAQEMPRECRPSESESLDVEKVAEDHLHDVSGSQRPLQRLRQRKERHSISAGSKVVRNSQGRPLHCDMSGRWVATFELEA